MTLDTSMSGAWFAQEPRGVFITNGPTNHRWPRTWNWKHVDAYHVARLLSSTMALVDFSFGSCCGHWPFPPFSPQNTVSTLLNKGIQWSGVCMLESGCSQVSTLFKHCSRPQTVLPVSRNRFWPTFLTLPSLFGTGEKERKSTTPDRRKNCYFHHNPRLRFRTKGMPNIILLPNLAAKADWLQ